MYCVQDDILKQITEPTLIQLTNDLGESTIDTIIVEEAIIYSSTLIDGYLRGRYSLPLGATFPLLRIIAIDLSIYRLYSRRMIADIPESILNQYKEAIKTLEKLQKGIITLDIETTEQTLINKEYRSNKTAESRIFNEGKLNAY